MSGERVGWEPDPYFESKPGGQDDRPIFNHVKIKLLQSDERPVPARIDTASWLDWRVGILLALPFFIAFGWAPGHWPGTAVNPGGANIVLHFAGYYLAVFSFYCLLTSIVSQHTAFWAALFMGLDPGFLYSLGEGMSYGMAIAWALGAAAGLVWAAKSRRWIVPMMLSGLLFSASVNAHFFSLAYLPVLYLTFLYLNHENQNHPVRQGLAWFVTGAVLGCVFLFDSHSLAQAFGNFIQQTAGGAHNNFAEAFSLAQLPSMFDLHIMTAVWLLSAVLLFTAKGPHSGFAAYWSSPSTRPYGFCLFLCFIYGLMILTMEFGLRLSVLGIAPYAGFCLPMAYLGLAGVLERGGFTQERSHRFAAALFLASLTLFSYPSIQAMLRNGLDNQYLWAVLLFWMVCLALLWQLPAIRRIEYRRATAVVLLLLAGFFLTGHDHPVWKKNGSVESPPQLTQVTGNSYE